MTINLLAPAAATFEQEMRPPESIRMGTRFRKDAGDIASLADSIRSVGLLHPIVITPDNGLVAGQRRLAACTLLGWREVPVTVVDLVEIVAGEFAENTARKDFLPTEMVAIKRALAPLVATPEGRPSGKTSATCASFPASHPKTTEKVATHVGTSGRTLEYAEAVVKAAEAEPEKYATLATPHGRIGPYTVYRILGRGGNGVALAARHEATGPIVTLKVGAGTEGPVAEWLGDDLPPTFLAVFVHEITDEIGGVKLPWVAREPAVGTWSDYLRRRQGAPVPLREVFALFRMACASVAALHGQAVFRWSAHSDNIFRVRQGWRLGDLTRCVMATTADDPRFLRYFGLTDSSPAERAQFLASLDAGPWNAVAGSGICAHDPDRERRLRVDDCAMLGGLLVDLLGANRWIAFSQALQTDPLCSGVYDLTGNRRRDRALSAVLNQCWRGDAGGALLVANAGRGDQATYSDPRELLDDVAGVFGDARAG